MDMMLVCWLVKFVQHWVVSEEVLAGTDFRRWGKRDYTWHCHHQNDSCIKTGRDESHFNVSLIVRDKVTRQCPQTATFEVRGDPKQNRTMVLLIRLTPVHWPSWLTDTVLVTLPFCSKFQAKGKQWVRILLVWEQPLHLMSVWAHQSINS